MDATRAPPRGLPRRATASTHVAVAALDEARRLDQGFESEAIPPLVCGTPPAHCSPTLTGEATWRNLDSDCDGLDVQEEMFHYRTDPRTPNTTADH